MDTIFSLVTLTLLEIILGIDNIIFLAIIAEKLPLHQQANARKIGLALAWISRLLLLASAVWITKLTTPLFSIFNLTFSGRDLFLLAGGVFLLIKATQEIHIEFDSDELDNTVVRKTSRFGMVIIQIALLDIVFSLDSVLTAIGLTSQFWLMATAITIAIITMIFASAPLSELIKRYPTIKMLALSFLILIGVVLIADSFHSHVPRGYIYFAMGFSLGIEFLNILKSKRKAKQIKEKV